MYILFSDIGDVKKMKSVVAYKTEPQWRGHPELWSGHYDNKQFTTMRPLHEYRECTVHKSWHKVPSMD